MAKKRHAGIAPDFPIVENRPHIEEIQTVGVLYSKCAVLTGIIGPVFIEKGKNQCQSKCRKNKDFEDFDQFRRENRISFGHFSERVYPKKHTEDQECLAYFPLDYLT
jgi:hypothetical protein